MKKDDTIKRLEDKVDNQTKEIKKLLNKVDNMQHTIDNQTHIIKKTYTSIKSISDLPTKLDNRVSSENSDEHVFIWYDKDEINDNNITVNFSARTTESLKKLKLPTNYIEIRHINIANAKDCSREIIKEANDMDIIIDRNKNNYIIIDINDIQELNMAIDKVINKLNRSAKKLGKVIELSPINNICNKWNTTPDKINELLTKYNISIDKLNDIVNGKLLYTINNKSYSVGYSSKYNKLKYAVQIDNSIKWYHIKYNSFI